MAIASPGFYDNTTGLFDVMFATDGERLLTASGDGQARLWRIPTNGFARHTWRHPTLTELARFSPGEKRLAVMGLGNLATIWDTTTGAAACEPLAHPARALDCGWRDVHRLVMTCVDENFREWKIPSGRLLSTRTMPAELRTRVSGRLRSASGMRRPARHSATSGARQPGVAGDPAPRRPADEGVRAPMKKGRHGCRPLGR